MAPWYHSGFVSLSALLRACCPIIQIIREDIKQGWSPYWSLACTSGYWPLTSNGLWVWPFIQFSIHITSHPATLASSASPWECYGKQHSKPFWRQGKQHPLLSLPEGEKGLSECLCLSLLEEANPSNKLGYGVQFKKKIVNKLSFTAANRVVLLFLCLQKRG